MSSADADRNNIRAWDSLYGRTQQSVWGRTPVSAIQAFLPEVRTALGETSRLLDAATGEGRHLGLLRDLPGRVSACDASGHALAKVTPEDRAAVPFVCCNLARLPFLDRTFDLVLIWDPLETLPEVDGGWSVRRSASGGRRRTPAASGTMAHTHTSTVYLVSRPR